MTRDELIQQARHRGLWLHCGYQNLWFSPDELEEANQQGSFKWGAETFTLADPAELIVQTQSKVQDAQNALKEVCARIDRSKGIKA